MIRYFYRVDSQDMITSAYRFMVDEETETVTDEKWTPNGWVDSGDKVVEFLITGLGDLQEVTELDVKKYSPEVLETTEVSYVSKSAEERRYTLGPMYVPDRIDAHNEWTDSLELQKSVWEYVRSGDRRIRLQHDREVVAGEWVEVMAWPYEVSVPMQKSEGTQDVTFPKDTVFLGVIWEPWAWELVKAGKLRGYSVGGRAQRLEVDLPVSKEAMPVDGPTVESVHEDALMPSKRKKRKKDESEKTD
jgi:hypothetical protein